MTDSITLTINMVTSIYSSTLCDSSWEKRKVLDLSHVAHLEDLAIQSVRISPYYYLHTLLPNVQWETANSLIGLPVVHKLEASCDREISFRRNLLSLPPN